MLDLTVTTVFENGLSSKFRQIVFQPLTDAAAALARQHAFQYQADSERVQLRGARVFRGDGTVDEAIESGEGAADNPAIAMYTSARTFYVQFPRLEPGDVVELRYRIDSMSTQNQFADYFGDVEYLQGSEPTAHAEYDLITPKSRKLYVDAKRLPGLKQSVVERGNSRIYRFEVDHVPPLTPEPSMPPWPSVLGFVHVSTYASWKEMGRWYWGLVHDQLDVDEETRKLAHRIAQGKTTELDKVKAVYDWVVDSTRYVALEFGIYGYKPHRCVQTVSRGWGDCKDKAAVIVTLLKELGIDSTMVIVRSGMRGDFDSNVASLAPFDHAIAYVPSLDLYLDGTAEFTGSSELPGMDQGALALQVNRGDSVLVRLPVSDPEKSVRKREVTATLRKDGSAQLDVAYTTTGTSAASWRRRFHAEGTRRDRLTEDLGGEFAGFELLPGAAGVQVSTLDDIEQPVAIKAHGVASRLARQEGQELSVPVTPGFRLTPAYASLSARKLDVKLPPLGTLDDTFVVKLPAGMHVVSAPPAAKGDGPFGSYTVSVDRDAGRVVVRTRLTLKTLVVTPDKYAAFKQFCADADAALTPRLILGPG
jgi:transglutaminase-like putative cysteine protease